MRTIYIAFFGALCAALLALFFFTDSMTELKHEIIINSPPEKVWDVLENLEEVARYNPTVASAKYISVAREGVGAARECILRPEGKVKERIVGIESGKYITMELYESSWPVQNFRWTTTIEKQGNTTVVRQKLTYEPRGLVGSVINTLVMKRNINATVGNVFLELKKYVEAK